MTLTLELAERRLVPDRLIRFGIRRLLSKRLADEARAASRPGAPPWTRAMAESPVALATDAANAQHYEVPAAFYREVLGRNLKYSSAYWDAHTRSLSDAEDAMLRLTAERADLRDGQRILELGCGWGSLSLHMARRFPNASILAISNSNSQREWIESVAKRERLTNIEVLTANVNHLLLDRKFDRVVSVEMFEHMRNWELLLSRISDWLEADGRLFLHFFAHATFAYPFESSADDDWMGQHFFTGGMMPSKDLLEQLNIPFAVEQRWDVSGQHYAKTAEAWLANLDKNQSSVRAVFERSYGRDESARMLQRWRMFFLACAELFGFAAGSEWLVTHALLRPEPKGVAS